MGESKHTPGPLQIVFDGPPGPTSGRFVEVERDGRSLKAGEWHQRPDGYWVLEIDPGAAAPLMLEAHSHILSVLAAPGSAESKLEIIREHAHAAIKAATGGEP